MDLSICLFRPKPRHAQDYCTYPSSRHNKIHRPLWFLPAFLVCSLWCFSPSLASMNGSFLSLWKESISEIHAVPGSRPPLPSCGYRRLPLVADQCMFSGLFCWFNQWGFNKRVHANDHIFRVKAIDCCLSTWRNPPTQPPVAFSSLIDGIESPELIAGSLCETGVSHFICLLA